MRQQPENRGTLPVREGRRCHLSHPRTARFFHLTMHLGCKGVGEGETGREENGSGSVAMGMGTVVIQAMRER